jgi:geranylgeranyl pyrophosphate synthase
MTRAQEYVRQAKQHLRDFTASTALTSLYTLADYVVSRDV